MPIREKNESHVIIQFNSLTATTPAAAAATISLPKNMRILTSVFSKPRWHVIKQ